MDSIDVVNFLGSDIDSDDEYHSEDKNVFTTNICHEKTKEVVNLQIKNHFSHAATTRVVDLMNTMPNVSIKIPKTTKRNRSRNSVPYFIPLSIVR